MSIFPDNYVPAAADDSAPSNYFDIRKLKDGQVTTLRLCGFFGSGHALCGYKYFTEAGRPRCFRDFPKNYMDDIGLSYDGKTKGTGEKDKPSFFLNWVALRKERKEGENFQVVDLSQRSVREQLEAILDMEDYLVADGEMANFYLTITRKGEKLNTKYNVVPTLKVASKADQAAWEQARDGIWLPVLYDGGDPFQGRPSEGAPTSNQPLTRRDELGADKELSTAGVGGQDDW